METLDRLRALLPGEIAERLERHRVNLREVRLRAGRPVQLIYGEDEWLSGAVLDQQMLIHTLSALMDYSLYAREEELRQGFFTMTDGCRVGVCGRMVFDGDRVSGLTAVGSVCIRISREVQGCGEAVLNFLRKGLRSVLVLSPPGMGKTTLLRELARRLSNEGHNVCVADERHELAACVGGQPTMDLGLRTDVMDGGPKRAAIRHMLRASAPEIIVTDEIGDEGDAGAVAEAARCGVCVITSAHAAGFDGLMARKDLKSVVDTGVFELGVLLGPHPGQIASIRNYIPGEGWHEVGAGALCGGGVSDLREDDRGGRPAEGKCTL